MSDDLKHLREASGWSQKELADRLGVSQAYVAMLEKGQRRLTPAVARKLVRLGASPTVLPPRPYADWNAQRLAEQFGALGYPGFAYLAKYVRKRNPVEVVLASVSQGELEARLVEALPWVLMRYYNMDLEWLVREAKQRNLQNRLGFVATLACEKSEQVLATSPEPVRTLLKLELELEPSRLDREDTLGRRPTSEFGREWLRANRSDAARRWNLLTTWRAEDLRFAT